MVINKQLGDAALPTIHLTNFLPAGTAQLWQLTAASTITRLSDISFSGTTITNSLPAQSIMLFVVPTAVLPGPAGNPNPAHGATNVPVQPGLSWTAGTNATAHRLYFGISSNAVANATTNSPEFKGSLTNTNYAPGALACGTTYYWRVDAVAGVYAITGAVWAFTTPMQASAATAPHPAHGATGMAVNPTLSWTAGVCASSHRFYFGANSNAVQNVTPNSPELRGDLVVPGYAPGLLASSGRFYWRVDAMMGDAATPGPVWTFATAVDPTPSLPLDGALISSDAFRLSFPSQVGQTYRVERTDSLSPPDWVPVADHLVGTGDLIQITNSGPSLRTQQFYRVVILPP